jgi:hypothetical protein
MTWPLAFAEAVIALAVAAVLVHLVDYQAGLGQRHRLIVGEDAFQAVPAGRRVAEAEAGGDFAGQAAVFQVRDRVGGAAQLAAVEIAGLGHRLAQRHALRLHLRALGRRNLVVLLGHDHAHVLCQVLDGIDKAHARVFDQEADRRAMRAAAEAMVELLGRTDREAGRFFAVKRAQAHEIRAAFFQLHVTSDNVNDIDAV